MKSLKQQKEEEKEKRKEIREQKKFLKELKIKERSIKKEAKELSKQIVIKDLKTSYFPDLKYEIPNELKVDNNYSDNYVVVALSLNTEEVFKYKKQLSNTFNYANVISDSGATHTFYYYQMRKFIKGYDKISREMQYIETLLSTRELNLNKFKKNKK